MIKAVIFDLGGVILKHSGNLLTNILSQIFSVSEEQANKWWNEYRVRLLTGKLSSEEFLQELR